MREPVEALAPVIGQAGVRGDGPEQTGREPGVDAFEELEKDDANPVALGQESDIVGGGFGAQDGMVADVLLDDPVPVMAPDDRIRQVQVFNLC